MFKTLQEAKETYNKWESMVKAKAIEEAKTLLRQEGFEGFRVSNAGTDTTHLGDTVMFKGRDFNFNTCPLCKEEGMNVIIMYDKTKDASEPCNGCGVRFRPYIIPERENFKMIEKGRQFHNEGMSETFEATTSVYAGMTMSMDDFKCVKGDHVKGMAYPDWLLHDVWLALNEHNTRQSDISRKTV